MAESNTMKQPDMRVYAGAHVNKIFVYGTLKKTFLRHQALENCKFVCNDSLRGYLFNWGDFPAFVPEITGTEVLGEIYEYDPKEEIKTLGRLDAIECVPNLYWRLPFLTKEGHAAWAYWMPHTSINASRKLIYGGKWIGKNSPQCDFGLYLAEHSGSQWPRKPKMKFHGPARCIVVQQSFEIQKDCMDYPPLPTKNEIILANSYTSRNGEPEPTPVEVKSSVKKDSIVQLEWLGEAGAKTHEICNETSVDGI